MTDETTAGRGAVAGQVERPVRPCAWAYTDRKGWLQALFDDEPHDLYACNPLYDQAALDAAVAAERERCAKLCEDISDEYQHREGAKYPELRTDAEAGASKCAAAIRKA